MSQENKDKARSRGRLAKPGTDPPNPIPSFALESDRTRNRSPLNKSTWIKFLPDGLKHANLMQDKKLYADSMIDAHSSSGFTKFVQKIRYSWIARADKTPHSQSSGTQPSNNQTAIEQNCQEILSDWKQLKSLQMLNKLPQLAHL